MAQVSIIRPEGDATEQAMSGWAAHVHGALATAGSPHTLCVDLRGPAASPLSTSGPAISSALKRGRLTVYLGHGIWNALGGGAGGVLIDVTNVGDAAGNIIAAIACQSAWGLGSNAVGQPGVAAYLGFDEDLGWHSSAANDFGGAALSGPAAMIAAGITSDQAAQRMRDEFNLIVQTYRYGKLKNAQDATLIWLLAAWDRDHVALYGSGSETV